MEECWSWLPSSAWGGGWVAVAERIWAFLAHMSNFVGGQHSLLCFFFTCSFISSERSDHDYGWSTKLHINNRFDKKYLDQMLKVASDLRQVPVYLENSAFHYYLFRM